MHRSPGILKVLPSLSSNCGNAIRSLNCVKFDSAPPYIHFIKVRPFQVLT